MRHWHWQCGSGGARRGARRFGLVAWHASRQVGFGPLGPPPPPCVDPRLSLSRRGERGGRRNAAAANAMRAVPQAPRPQPPRPAPWGQAQLRRTAGVGEVVWGGRSCVWQACGSFSPRSGRPGFLPVCLPAPAASLARPRGWHLALLSPCSLFSLSGRASHPGPPAAPFFVVSANCTSLDQLPLLAAVLGSPGFLALQEPRGSLDAASRARAAARPLGAKASSCFGSNQYLSCATKDAPLRLCPVELGGELADRLAHYVVEAGQGVLHVFNVYAPCGSGRYGSATDACSALLTAALALAAELGQAPCLVLGDFNQDPLPSQGAAMLAVGGWRDLALDLGATTRPGGGRRGRRIDRVYANAAASAAVRSVELRWDTGIATHAALVVELDVAPRGPYLCRVRPAPLAGPPAAGWDPAGALALAEDAWARAGPAFEEAVSRADVDGVWALLNSAALSYLRGRAASDAPRRGGPLATLSREASAPVDAEGYASAYRQQRRLAAVRACDAALRACGDGPLNPEAVLLLRGAQAAVADARCDRWAQLVSDAFTGRAAVEAAARRLADDYRAELLTMRAARRDRWHEFVRGDVLKGGRRTFRWVRQPALQEPAPLVQGPEGLAGGPAAELALAEPCWKRLWAATDVPLPAEQALRECVRALPPFPPILPLTDAAVAAGIWALPLGRAPGPDDWSAEDLRLWPEVLVRGLAALFRLVERCGRWPAALAAADVVLLPKAGSSPDEPLQRRPITLLPIPYRLWARLRLPVVESWRATWDPAVHDAPKGADGQAWDLGWDIACSAQAGHEVAGLAVDMAKCYDSVRHPVLRRTLVAAGWPAAILGPLLGAYAFRRRLRIGDAVGRFTVPVTGIPAGCPLAVASLSVLTWPWQVAVTAAGATAARRYVDDLTAWHRGPAEDAVVAAAAMWSATALYVRAAQLTVNDRKSGVFASSPSGRATLAADDPAAPVLLRFKDLGIDQKVGAPGLAASAARVAGTMARFERLAGLPLPYAQRSRAVAAAGVAAATYGALAGAPPGRDLAKLRTWAGKAVWRGGRFGAVELRLLLGAEDGRADPAGVFALAPLLALARALRCGWAQQGDAAALLDGPSRHPMVYALRRSMRVLALAGPLTLWEAGPLADHPGGQWDPAAHGLDATRHWLATRWCAAAACAVAARRPAYSQASLGIDWAAAGRALAGLGGSGLGWAAARSAMVGDSVTATRASHWRDVPRSCPHCSEPEETVEHQLWACPRWDSTRQRAAARFGFDHDHIIAGLAPLTAHSLLRGPCVHRAAAHALLAAPDPPLPPPRPLLAGPGRRGYVAWTDGAGSRPASGGLERAAWGVHFSAGSGPRAGPVPGSQSVQRAELYAAVVAASSVPGPLLVVSDSQYVVRGIHRLRGRLRPPEWKHADLWHHLWCAALLGGLDARWVPAHRAGPDPPLLSKGDWVGNAGADKLAGQALLAAQPPYALVAAAEAAEERYHAVVAVGAAALEAQLAWAHAGCAVGPTRFPRKRVRVQPRPLPGRGGAGAAAGREWASAHSACPPDPPPGVHALRVELLAGRPWLRCSRCARAGGNPAQWGALAYSVCSPVGSGNPLPAPTWTRDTHCLEGSGPGLVTCRRCGLVTQVGRVAQVARRMCISRRLSYDGTPFPVDWGLLIVRALGWLRGPLPARPPSVLQLLCARGGLIPGAAGVSAARGAPLGHAAGPVCDSFWPAALAVPLPPAQRRALKRAAASALEEAVGLPPRPRLAVPPAEAALSSRSSSSRGPLWDLQVQAARPAPKRPLGSRSSSAGSFDRAPRRLRPHGSGGGLVLTRASAPARPAPCRSPSPPVRLPLHPLPWPAPGDARPRPAAGAAEAAPKRRRFVAPAASGPAAAFAAAAGIAGSAHIAIACSLGSLCLACGAVFHAAQGPPCGDFAAGCTGWVPVLPPLARALWREASCLPEVRGLRPWSPAWAAAQRRGFLPPD